MRVWPGLVRLWVGTSCRLLWAQNRMVNRGRDISWPAEWQSDSQGRPWPAELFAWICVPCRIGTRETDEWLVYIRLWYWEFCIADNLEVLSTLRHIFKAKRKISQSRLEHSLQCVRSSSADLVFAVGLEAWEQTLVACWRKLWSQCVQPVVLRRDHLWTAGAPPTDVIYQTLVFHGWDLTFMIMPPWRLESVDLLQMLSVEVHSRRLFHCLVAHRLQQQNSRFCMSIAYTQFYFVTVCTLLSTRKESYLGPTFCCSWPHFGLNLTFRSRTRW
jgi:hypothetical protein